METYATTNEIIDGAVEQVEPGTWRVCWELAGRGGSAAIYHGTSPDAIDRETPVAVSDDGCVDIDWLDPGMRHYWYRMMDAWILTGLIPACGTTSRLYRGKAEC